MKAENEAVLFALFPVFFDFEVEYHPVRFRIMPARQNLVNEGLRLIAPLVVGVVVFFRVEKSREHVLMEILQFLKHLRRIAIFQWQFVNVGKARLVGLRV